MTLKQASFDIHKQLSALSPEIKRSHCRELIAAAFRIRSMAKAESNGFILPAQELPFDNDFLVTDNGIQDKTNAVFIDRASALIPDVNDQVVFNITSQTIKHFKLIFITFEELVDEFEMSGLIDGSDESDGYWYHKRESGQKLSSQAQIDFANSFERKIKKLEQFKELLHISLNKGFSNALRPLSSFYEGTKKESFLNEYSNIEGSKAIIALFEETGNEEYLLPAAMHGSYEALQKIVTEFSDNAFFDKENVFQAHYYNAIAESYGYRLTESSTSAVGDPDYGSNDDYYGPVYMGGYEGIDLPEIDKELERKAIDKAKRDIQNLNTNV